MGITRCGPNDPNRCTSAIKNGTEQCHNLSADGYAYCSMHGGHESATAKKRNYNFTRYQRQIEEKADSPVLKQLHEEIGLMRFLLEEQINRCETDAELMINSGPIANLVGQIEKLVTSCNTLDSKLGNTLDKNQLLKFATVIIDIINDCIEDPELVELVADRILKALGDESTFEVE